MIDPETDLLSVPVLASYYDILYQKQDVRKLFRYPVRIGDTGSDLIELLSCNEKQVTHHRKNIRAARWQAFKTAGGLFQVIDSRTVSVIVPYDENAKTLISGLRAEKNPYEQMKLMRQAQQYTVGIYHGTERTLGDENALEKLGCGAVILEKRFYHDEYGITTEGGEMELLVF